MQRLRFSAQSTAIAIVECAYELQRAIRGIYQVCERYVTTRRCRLKKCLRRKIIRGRAFGLAELKGSASDPVTKQLLPLLCYWTRLGHEVTENISILYFSEKVRISRIERLNQEKVPILPRFHVNDCIVNISAAQGWEYTTSVAPSASTRAPKHITLDLFESNCCSCACIKS